MQKDVAQMRHWQEKIQPADYLQLLSAVKKNHLNLLFPYVRPLTL